MRYKIRDIGEAGIDVCVDVSAAWLASECSDLAVTLSQAGVRLEGRIEPAGEGYLLRGNLRGVLTVSCARCLEPAAVTLDSPMAISFVEKAEDDDEEDPAEAQDDLATFEHGVIDVGGPIRDEILLAVPMSVVCREDCAGICPSCGRNRNLTPCGCEKRAIDTSKLGALAKIKLQ